MKKPHNFKIELTMKSGKHDFIILSAYDEKDAAHRAHALMHELGIYKSELPATVRRVKEI